MKGVHHVGVAVEDLDEAISSYERLFGGELAGRETQDEQGVEAASLLVGNGHRRAARRARPGYAGGTFPRQARARGCTTSPTRSTTSPAELARLKGEGARLIDAAPRPGLFGTQVAFVHPESVHGVLSELVARG